MTIQKQWKLTDCDDYHFLSCLFLVKLSVCVGMLICCYCALRYSAVIRDVPAVAAMGDPAVIPDPGPQSALDDHQLINWLPETTPCLLI